MAHLPAPPAPAGPAGRGSPADDSGVSSMDARAACGSIALSGPGSDRITCSDDPAPT
jgi:hypothetical protein